MAKSLVTSSGQVFIPGAYVSYAVQNNPSGLAANGVLMLVGESDAGPDYTQEADIELNAFGPDQVADVQAKYKSGPLVDAMRNAASAANDPDIIGSFTRAILVKTNVGTKASGILPKIGGGTYSTLFDKSFGALGNQIVYQSKLSVAEVIPTTGLFTYIPNAGTVQTTWRVNGAAQISQLINANESPSAFQALIDGLTGPACSGGVDRVILTVSGTLAVAVVSGNTVTVTRSIAWAVTPSVGDTMTIPLGSVIVGAGSANVGAYVITAATATVITATKLSDAGASAPVPGTITAPVAVSATNIVAVTDVKAWSPITITIEAAAVIAGVGKTLEMSEQTGGTDLFSRMFYVLGTTTPATFVSKQALATDLFSSAEYKVEVDLSRTVDSISEAWIAGGEIALKLEYLGTTATCTITATTFATTVTGGSGISLSQPLSNFASINDLVIYINAQPGYKAAVGTGALGSLPPTALDQVVAAGICSDWGAFNGRIKIDAYRLYNLFSLNSQLAQEGNPTVRPAAGLPDVMAAQSLFTGGAKGGTSDAQVLGALAALENAQGNFVIPLMSRDATADIADALTDSTSTYTIAATHANTKAHVLNMSTYKRRRNRQGILSIADTFVNQQNVAANIASFRCNMVFQDFKQTSSSGSIVQFLPWMGAVMAGSMQAAAFYKSIEHKGINTSGILSHLGDFNYKSDGQMETALQAGLMPARNAPGGGFMWVSDQTTYGRDNNFVFNSLQAVYDADTVALTTASRMEQMFVGQSIADISATVAKAALAGIMADMMRLKLIAPSDDAPKGYKNDTIKIVANSMFISLEVCLDSAIDFVSISFLVVPAVQTA